MAAGGPAPPPGVPLLSRRVPALCLSFRQRIRGVSHRARRVLLRVRGGVPLSVLGESRTHPDPVPRARVGTWLLPSLPQPPTRHPQAVALSPTTRRKTRGEGQPVWRGGCCRGWAVGGGLEAAPSCPPGCGSAAEQVLRLPPVPASWAARLLPSRFCAAAVPSTTQIMTTRRGLICYRFTTADLLKWQIHGFICRRYSVRCGVSSPCCRGK